MQRIIKKIITTLLLGITLTTLGEVHAEPIQSLTDTTRQYVVSGVLQQSGEGMTIYLTHTIETARSEEEAIGSFTRKVKIQYPTFSIFMTKASSITKPSCGTEI